MTRRTPLQVLVVLLACATLLQMSHTARASINTTGSPGWNIFTTTSLGYRYGPSIILDSTGMNVWTCSPGASGAWDYIRYKKSTDGGHTWGTESIVLQPTPGSADNFSTCDPGVVEFGGYYYIAYTSTTDARGTNNNVFVARGTSPTGPFSKWNGSGWGGNPAPFITYNGPSDFYGAGEPSLVVLGTTLYIYYSWVSTDSSGNPILQTRVSTASTSDANWPGNVTYQGVAVNKRNDQAADSCDVKYIDAYGKFLAVNTINRFGPKAYIQAWESTDGVNFVPSDIGRDNLLPYLHNDGISGDGSGHIDVTQTQYVGYAYGSQWAVWNTYLNPWTLSNDDLPGKVSIYSVEPKNGAIRLEFQTDTSATSYTIKYGTQSGNYTSSITGVAGSPYTLSGLTNGTRYFIAVDAVNSNGNSVDSSQATAIPQNFQLSTAVSATASSQLSGWAASNAIDGSYTTTYSSAGHTAAASTEWIYVDEGANVVIGRLVVSNRQRELTVGPTFDGNLDTQIQVSTDASTWFNVDYRLNMYPIFDDDGYAKTVFDFAQPIYARYVRLYSTKLNADSSGNYYLQVAEIQPYASPAAAIASTYLTGWEPGRILDLDPNTSYSSAAGNTTQWVGINLGSVQTIDGINLTPRIYNSAPVCFPVNFTLQSSTDGVNWTNIPGQSYTNYPSPGTNVQSFTFSSPVQAQYIRVYATQLSKDQYNNYYLQMAGMVVKQTIPFTATASSTVNSGFAVSNVTDGISATAWSSTAHSSANSTEWLQLDMGASYRVQDLRLVPRDGSCFPSAFAITYSTDGVNWTAAPGQSYIDFANPASLGTTPNPVQLMQFSTPITARYFKITATQLTADSFGNYYFQLADVFIDQ
ncbi:MAG TPA: discoidin domain-containing protein [Steroidobacteraceae bacterium]|nr:discoidin domain-containing protein [Steroidobacteraceae bacterium]